tara:strand:+ start:104 stop:286 length:183 start_codon:yes stop_codon:yes gene_type:complete
MKFNDEKLKMYFAYLVDLRDSGITNMWGAAPYLEKVFPELTKAEASKVLVLWIESFQEDK